MTHEMKCICPMEYIYMQVYIYSQYSYNDKDH